MLPSPAPASVFAWAGAALFAASLGYFLFTYAVTFGRVATGEVTLRDLVWNLLIFTVFALHHTLFARLRIRDAIARTVPAGLERSVYVWVASALLIAVCWWWRPIPGVAWAIEGPAAWALLGAQLGGLWLTLRSAVMIDVWDLAGLSGKSGVRTAGSTEFKTSGPYGWVRHPIYAGWFLIVFAVPLMTTTRLEFAIVSGVYVLLAIPLEERTLRATAGAAYTRYAARVRWRLVPGVF